MKASLAQVAFVIFCCTVAVAIETNDVNLCKRQPFRGRCPSIKGRGPVRSQFVLRYYLRDDECVSYPFGHCANDENEPMLYRYKEECEKACLNTEYNSDSTIENNNVIGKSGSSLGGKITDNGIGIGTGTDEQISTTSEAFSKSDATTSSQRTAFAVQKNTSHKLLTECERLRQASESGLIKHDFIPICTADGSFRPLQCKTEGKNCFCVDHNGVKIPNSDSNNTKEPNCKRIVKTQKSLTNECLSPVDSGPCTATIARWYYDNREQQCIQFEYSGCGGNGNNYRTRIACEKQCKLTKNEVKCKNGLEPLKNRNGQLIDCSSDSTCPHGYLCSAVQLGSACCPINTSNVASNICQLPKERGPCDQYELRFYYNNRLGECKYFFFGGCEGNANNFERVEECERICRQHGAKIAAAPIVSPPQLITSGPQMRKLNKEFGIKNTKKTSEENESVELTGSTDWDITGNTDDGGTTNEATLRTKDTSISSSTTMSHDRSTANKDLFATDTATTSTDQSKLHVSQKIDQNIYKKNKQKGTTTLLNSNNTDKVTDFTTVEPENTTAKFDKSEKFTASDDESNGNGQKFSNESVVATGQQLSSSEEQVKMSTSTSKTAAIGYPSTLTPSISPVALSLSSTATLQSIISSTTESVISQPTESIDDRCFQKRDQGTCAGQFIRWHWDSERNTCQIFTYSGCGGNGNNFRSREDCFAACHQPTDPTVNIQNVCEHSIHPGDCTGVFQRFAFDSAIGDCRPFTYTGCGGNGNNFGSSLECRNRCIIHKPTLSTNVCEHPIEVGECSGVFPRFAYDLMSDECRQFTYGGCGGNGNNFGSMAECKTKCVRGQPGVSVQCPSVNVSLCVEPCILFTNRRGCHECTCPVAQPSTENDLVESSTSSPAVFDTSSDEFKALETKQPIEKDVEKKRGRIAHPEKTSQTNSVTELGEKCSQPMDAGPCKNFIERWFFDIDSGLCKSFQYGGCAGNRNHFFSKHECEIHCARFFNGRTGRRRIAAYQSASDAQHNTLTWSQSAEILDEHEHEVITDNQQSTAHDVLSPITNNSRNTARADSWKHVVESDSEDRRHVDVKLENATSRPLGSNAKLSDLHSLQQSIALQNKHLDNIASQQLTKDSVREQQQQQRQPWSISSQNKLDIWITSTNIPQQTVIYDEKQVPMEAIKQQHIYHHQIDDKWRPIFSNAQNDTIQTTNASRSMIIPVQESKVYTQIESTSKRKNLIPQQKQSQAVVQKIDISQIQQRNELSKQTPSEQLILRHNVHMSQNETAEDITSLASDLFDSEVARQMLTNHARIQNSKKSSDEQLTGLQEVKMSEPQIARIKTNDPGNKLKKLVENRITNEALISNRALDNSVDDNYNIPTDRNSGRLISNEIITSVDSFPPKFRRKNGVHRQMNKVNEPWKEINRFTEKIANSSTRSRANSQSVNTHLSHKAYGNAIAVAKDTESTQLSRDSVLRHHVRIINQGSALETSTSNLSLSVSSSVLPTLSPSISLLPSSTIPPSSTLSSSTSSSSLSSPLLPSDTKTHLNTFTKISHSSTSDNNENFNGARGTHLKHAVDVDITPSSTEEFSHGFINTLEHKGQKFIASSIENEVTLPATQNNFDAITNSVNDNAIIDTQERSDLSPIMPPEEWEMELDEYKIIDKIDTTLQNSLTHESLTSTITSTTKSFNEPVQTVVENVAPSLVTLNTTHIEPTSLSSTTSISHSILSSVTTIPANNITSTPSKIMVQSRRTPSQMIVSESTIIDNNLEGSLEPSIPSPPQILSQPIPSGKSWLYDGLQSIINSQILPDQHSQRELSEKKLSLSSFDTTSTFVPATFSTAINNKYSLPVTTTVMNTSKKPPPMSTNDPTIWSTSTQTLSPNAIDITFSNNELQTKKSVGKPEKFMKESEENHYFNADSSIFMNAPSFHNQTRPILSHDRIRTDKINTMTQQLKFALNGTRETEKVRNEGKIDAMNLSLKSSTPMQNFDNTPVNSVILKSGNDVLHQFATTTQEASTEISTSTEQPISQEASTETNQNHRVSTVESHSLHSLKHQQLQQSLPGNLNEITGQQFTVAHDTQVAQSTSFSATVKQGETEEVLRDQTTVNAHQEEEMASETLNQQNISDSQVTSETTPHAIVHSVTTLQQLQSEDDDTCVLPPDAGICRDYVPRWFYNSQTGKCEQFSYGSCGGNNNNFLDRQACEKKCSQGDSIKSQLPERCTYKKDEGHSNGYNVKWYFNVRNLRCEQMVYQGEGGNSNQFETLGECQTFCTPLDGKIPGMDPTTKRIENSLKTNSLLQQGFAASHDQETVSVTGTNKILKGQHHVHDISQNAAKNHHHRIIPDNDSIGNEEIKQISSKQYSASSGMSAQSSIPVIPVEQISHNLDTSTSETMAMRESASESSPLTNEMNQSGAQITERKDSGVKTFGARISNKNNEATIDLPNIFEDIGRTPSCPNGLKPMQHADGRPVMCLPGRNQCTGNSICYFNGVDFFCCPNAEDPYDEHVFGGYGGEEVKRGYKNVKKTPINSNELIVRKLRLRRQAQMFPSRPLTTINTAARIDSKIPKYSLARASVAVNGDESKQINNICMQDVNTGKCTEAHLRYFYDHRVSTCRLFYYSGCGGNENNFATEEECRQQCKSDKVHVEDTPPGSCPFGEPPLGDNAPVICGKDTGSFECPKGYYCRMGPPNVCCLEKFLPALEKVLMIKKNQKNIRFSPQQSRGNGGYISNEVQRGSEDGSPLLIVPTNICPDGSDALLDESTQQPLKCGLGYDGESFCPVGYYCSIDSEKNGRLCCQLAMMGVKIPPPPIIPPYFGLRPSNPGEVIPRGSLPSDYISRKHQKTKISNEAESSEEYQSHLALAGTKLATAVKPVGESHTSEEEVVDSSENVVASDETADSSENFVPSGETTDSSENFVPSDSKLQDEVYGRMMLKSNDHTRRTQALYDAVGNNVASPEAETNEVQIDIGEMKDPFESLEHTQKTTSDRSICLLKPNEGRTCREDESPPRTNLQYFYSTRDKRCKLYFYRGCGGSQNRFDTKRHCELTCIGV